MDTSVALAAFGYAVVAWMTFVGFARRSVDPWPPATALSAGVFWPLVLVFVVIYKFRDVLKRLRS